jgi:hypothetical protein
MASRADFGKAIVKGQGAPENRAKRLFEKPRRVSNYTYGVG